MSPQNNKNTANNTDIQLDQFIDKNLIRINLKGSTPKQVIRSLVETIYNNNENLSNNHSVDSLCEAVESREQTQSTALGKGIAFPHARIQNLDKFYLAIGICKTGADFQSIDKQPVKIICLMLSPINQTYVILKIMAALARFLNDEQRRNSFIEAEDILAVLNIFKESNIQISSRILAKDIMRPINTYSTLDETIQETARKMHLNHLDTLPVLDTEFHFHGFVSCLDIFKFGIPDFFSQLKTISFVRHIDPFEKYFHGEKNIRIKDIYRKETKGVIPADATLMEITFEMTTKNNSTLFVVEDGILKGIIDRFNIIDKILIS